MKVAPLAPPGASKGVLHYGEWYTIKLAGSTLPGKWTLTAGGVMLKVDHKKKGGVDGANSVFHGLTGTEKFEAEGEQHNDDERQAVADLLSQIVPQPGTSQNQFPLQLQCPHVAVFGFAIFVKILGSSPFLHIGPCRTKVKLFMEHWLPAKASAPSATNQPKRAIRNNRTGTTSHPAPASQPGAFNPPSKLS